MSFDGLFEKIDPTRLVCSNGEAFSAFEYYLSRSKSCVCIERWGACYYYYWLDSHFKRFAQYIKLVRSDVLLVCYSLESQWMYSDSAYYSLSREIQEPRRVTLRHTTTF